MTTLCTGGTSAPKAGTTLAVDFTISAISVALAEYGASWAIKAIPFVTSLPTFVLSTYCGTDPPAVPTFTQAEADAVLQLSFNGDFFTAIPKMVDLISHVMWYQVCECTSGTAVALPAAAAPPTGTAVPTDTPQALNAVCQGVTNGYGTGNPWVSDASTNGPWHFNDSGSPLLYMQWPVSIPTSFKLTFKNTTLTGSGLTFPFRWAQTTAYSTSPTGGAASHSVGPNSTYEVIVTAISASADPILMVWIDAITGSGTASIEGSMVEVFCGGAAPGEPQQPCCPPDPASEAKLDALIALTTLIQRQLAPFSTIHGAVHTGISGNGQLSVQGLVGLAVDLTTTPSRAGLTSGDPDQVYDVGWINVGTADGWGPRHFISSDPFLLSPVAGDVTLVGYSIPADVVVTITEIVREP